MVRIIFIILPFLLPTILSGQYEAPALGKAFDDSEVPRVDVNLAPDDFNRILGDIANDAEYEAQFIYTTSYASDTIEQVGFRLRGNTSRDKVKKSFKVSFNAFVKGQKWEGLEKVNLNGEANDPSLVRSKLAWDIFRSMEVPASRSNHVELYVNGAYRGLYLNVEHIDEAFIDKRFNYSDGNLYKCLWPADMNYKGSDPNLYKEEFWGRQAYELKTNRLADDYSDLAHLIDVLNNYSAADRICELEKILDVDGLIRCIAVDVLIGNWDGAFLNKNNFYLYYDEVTGLITFIPYDLDNTFGIDWFDVDWANTSLYRWSDISGESRPLYESILSIPEYKNRLSHYFSELLDGFLSGDHINSYLNNKLTLISASRESDSFSERDFDFSYDDFIESYESGVGGHVPYGLKEYISRRREFALDNMINNELVPAIKSLGYARTRDTLSFDIEIEGDSLVNVLVFYWQIDGGPFFSQSLERQSGKATVQIVSDREAEMMSYYLSMEYGLGTLRHFPFCKDGQLPLMSEASDLVVNEFVASNATGQVDNFGEQDDWIELFNKGGQTIDLSDYYLTDNPLDPNKWRLPEKYLYPAQFIAMWLDDDTEQGETHANFKLSKSGEYIGLNVRQRGGFLPVDSLSYDAQETDKSSSRVPNGYGDFVITDNITFELNNDESSAIHSTQEVPLVIYPNPTVGYLNIDTQGEVGLLAIYDSSGRCIKTFSSNLRKVPIGDLPDGLYRLQLVINDKTLWHTFLKN